MNTLKAYRQGDLGYFVVDSIPKELEESKDNIILQVGSSGNPHTFTGGIFYPKEEGQFTIGYLKAKKTKLHHKEHGKDFVLPDGNYRVVRQNEDTVQGLKQVID